MPVTDLFAASRRILRKLLGRSRRVALAAALVPLGTVGAPFVNAAPTVSLPPEFPATPFSIRITDMERIPGDPEDDAFRIEFQALAWANASFHALVVSANMGATSLDGGVPRIAGASVDPDGRGGPPGGNDIGPGTFDAMAIHSGWGRADIPDRLNDWSVAAQSDTFVQWDNFDFSIPAYPFTGVQPGGKPLLHPARSLEQKLAFVPGFGLDALGDSALDGGPEPYSPPSPGGGEPRVGFDLSNVIDGFVIDVDDWDEGEVFSFNWLMATVFADSGGLDHRLLALAIEQSDPFGYGVLSLVRIEPSIGTPAGNLPNAVFVGNTGFDQSDFSFYDAVYEIPNPAEFAAEFGAGITAPFLNPADNFFNAPINTQLIVPEPGWMVLVSSCVVGLAGATGRSRRKRTTK